MTRVLHASEDLMGAVRDGRVVYSRELADHLLDAMDFVGLMCEEIEAKGGIDLSHSVDSARLSEALRGLIAGNATVDAVCAVETDTPISEVSSPAPTVFPLVDIPEAVIMDAYRRAREGDALHWLVYTPAEECFFQGDDPLFQARQTPALLWGDIVTRKPWPNLTDLDTYRCVLDFRLLTAAPHEELVEYYRYVHDQVRITPVKPPDLTGVTTRLADGDSAANASPACVTMQAENPNEPLSEEDTASLDVIFAAQRQILMLDDHPVWFAGRLKAVAGVMINCSTACGDSVAQVEIESALEQALTTGEGAALLAWLDANVGKQQAPARTLQLPADADVPAKGQAAREQMQTADFAPPPQQITATADEAPKFGRRAEDQTGAKSLKVDQAKIEVLMNLIGELVVSKNALPYLAQRAENQYGVREVAREIKAQYAVINRIVEEMQGAIMQVRMMPVSFVLQRFPRLVRDISRKLGKEVNLVLEGEETEADKNIIESLADPLIHIVRNSLDHGLETPDVRLACGKSAAGTLTIRAAQEADRVVIEIIDDGKGIDPGVIKRKAYEKGTIDEATLERISDRDAINLVFAAGFSTVETVSDLSGRGVGMDVVRTGVEKVNGDVLLESEVGKGTCMRISLPLSMAVTNVMIVESDHQIFGVPIEHVVETVRISLTAIRSIKHNKTAVLRGRIVPLKSLNALLEIPAEPRANDDNELAVLVARAGNEVVGLIVDEFRETVEVIQKPLNGVLSSLSAYSGSALMGDGSVLMVLNIKEIV